MTIQDKRVQEFGKDYPKIFVDFVAHLNKVTDEMIDKTLREMKADRKKFKRD